MLTALGVQVLLQRARAVTSPGGPVVHQVVILYFFNEKPYLAKKTSEDDSALGVYSPEIPPRTDFFSLPLVTFRSKTIFFLSHTHPSPLNAQPASSSPFHTIWNSTCYGRFLRRVLGSERQRGWGRLAVVHVGERGVRRGSEGRLFPTGPLPLSPSTTARGSGSTPGSSAPARSSRRSGTTSSRRWSPSTPTSSPPRITNLQQHG